LLTSILLTDIHLGNLRLRILALHIGISLLLLGRFAGRRGDLGLGPGLGPVHDSSRAELNVVSSLVNLGGGDDRVDVLGLFALSDEVVLEPLLVGGTLLDLLDDSHDQHLFQKN
jgi:hypothetical protein